MLGDKKLDYVISIGTPSGFNYSYDLRSGAWLQVWRGDFMDASDMWHRRGEAQLARPLGSVVSFSDAPTVAQLPNRDSPWPDSVSFDDLKNDGYRLDQEGIPTFSYTIKGIKINDKIAPLPDGTALKRTLTVEKPTGNLYCRLLSANLIESIDKDLFRVDGKYYIKLDRQFNPRIRHNGQKQEMIVSLNNEGSPMTYSIIW